MESAGKRRSVGDSIASHDGSRSCRGRDRHQPVVRQQSTSAAVRSTSDGKTGRTEGYSTGQPGSRDRNRWFETGGLAAIVVVYDASGRNPVGDSQSPALA